MDCSVVIPVYNSEVILPDLIARLANVKSKVSERFEVVLVNDGSRDKSWVVICHLAQDYDWVRGINLMRNYGQHNALLAGIRAARYDTIVTMDDDLQNPPEELPRLLDKLDEGYDVVYGVPQAKQHGFWRVIGSDVTRLILRGAMGIEFATNASGFRAFRTRLRDAFAAYQNPFVAIDVLLSWGTTRFAAIPIRHDERKFGKSNYSLIKLVILALDVTTGYSSWPLRLASLVGFGFTLVGLGVFSYTLIRYLIEGGTVPSVRFIGSVIAIFSGAQLFALGIIGEYLARIHFRMMGLPAYLERERTQHLSKPGGIGHV